jgi:hypothetical protein
MGSTDRKSLKTADLDNLKLFPNRASPTFFNEEKVYERHTKASLHSTSALVKNTYY